MSSCDCEIVKAYLASSAVLSLIPSWLITRRDADRIACRAACREANANIIESSHGGLSVTNDSQRVLVTKEHNGRLCASCSTRTTIRNQPTSSDSAHSLAISSLRSYSVLDTRLKLCCPHKTICPDCVARRVQ